MKNLLLWHRRGIGKLFLRLPHPGLRTRVPEEILRRVLRGGDDVVHKPAPLQVPQQIHLVNQLLDNRLHQVLRLILVLNELLHFGIDQALTMDRITIMRQKRLHTFFMFILLPTSVILLEAGL